MLKAEGFGHSPTQYNALASLRFSTDADSGQRQVLGITSSALLVLTRVGTITRVLVQDPLPKAVDRHDDATIETTFPFRDDDSRDVFRFKSHSWMCDK